MHYKQLKSRRRHTLLTMPLSCLVLFFTLSVGCLDRISLPAPAGVGRAVVIQGTIIKSDPSVIRVFTNNLFDFTGNTVRPINVQFVEISDESGKTLRLPELALGVYGISLPTGSGLLDIDYGKQYRLHVLTRDDREYMSHFESVYPVPKVDQLRISLIEREFLNAAGVPATTMIFALGVDTPLRIDGFEDHALLKWDIERTFKVTDTPINPVVPRKVCYVTENVVGPNVMVFDGTKTGVDRIDDYTIHTANLLPQFSEGLYYTVYQQSISPGAFRYWDEARQVAERTGSMFEPPAGKVHTNFYNVNDPDDEVYGYFYAIEQDTVRIYVSPEFTGDRPAMCPPPGGLLTQGGICALPVCCNCLSVPNSTTVKPHFWTE